MSSRSSLFPLAAAGVTAFTLVAAIFLAIDPADAADQPDARRQVAAQPRTFSAPAAAAAAPTGLDELDEIAALETLQYALSEVADGSTYVWHRHHGMLSGMVQPTGSFKDDSGAVCRHVVVVLNRTGKSNKTEAVACRMANGVWKLDG